MTKRVVRAIDLLSIVLLLIGGLWVAGRSVPATFWFEPETLVVENSFVGENPVIGFSRTINRRAYMSYSVVVRNVVGLTVACDARSGPFWYEPEAELPAIITMTWWAPSDGRCSNLPPGSYIMETCWTLSEPMGGFFGPKKVCITSNVFERRG